MSGELTKNGKNEDIERRERMRRRTPSFFKQKASKRGIRRKEGKGR